MAEIQEQKPEVSDFIKRKQRIVELEALTDKLNKEIEELSKLKTVEATLNQTKSELTKTKSELIAANQNLIAAKSDNKKLSEDLVAFKKKGQDLMSVDDRLNETKSDLEKTKSELSEIKSLNEKLNQDIEKLNQTNSELNNRIENLTDTNSDLTKQAKGLNQEIENLVKTNKDLIAQNNELNWDSQELKRINESKNARKYWGMVALNTLMVFTAIAASFANVIHLGERYLMLIESPNDLDKIVCYASMTVFDLCIFFFAIYGRAALARIFAIAIMFIVFTKLSTPFVNYGLTSEYAERVLVGLSFSGFLAFVSVIMSEVIADKVKQKLQN